jgi:hypothetical protein
MAATWRFAVDDARGFASAWVRPWPERSALVGLRCVVRPTAAVDDQVREPAAGFVDLIVVDDLFFDGARPVALTSGPFQISQIRLSFDGPRPRTRTLNTRYDPDRGTYVTGVALDDPLLEGLMAGYTLWVDEPLEPGRVSLPLTGSRDAITSLIAVCP